MKRLLPLLMLLLGAALLLASCKKDPPPEETTAGTTTAATATSTQPATTEETTVEETTEPPATTTTKATDEPMTDDDTPRREVATPAEIRAEERRANNVLSSLDAEKIDKIVLEQTRPIEGGAQRFTYESSSPEAITAWVNIFDAMELSGAQFEFLSGGNLAVFAYVDGKRVELGCIEGNYLTNGRLKTMCRIDNYNALYGDIRSAAAMVSGEVVI